MLLDLIAASGHQGIRRTELAAAVAQSRGNEMKMLLAELRDAGKVCVHGLTHAARWRIGDGRTKP